MQVDQLAEMLSKQWRVIPGIKSIGQYSISMKNTFITRMGEIKKYQSLGSLLTRKCLGFSSDERLYLEAVYDQVGFYEGDCPDGYELRNIKFPVGQVLSHYKLMPSDEYSLLRDRHQYIDAQMAKGMPFSSFPATPIIHLLQLQCYDVVALEELHSQVLKHHSQLSRIGDRIKMSIDHSKSIGLNFRGLTDGLSRFRMFDLNVEFTGISTHRNNPVLVYHYESRGALKVSKQVGEREESNVGESYFYGDVYIGLSDGDLERATMNELLTMSRIAGSSEPLPLNRRRKIDYFRS